MLLTFDGVSDGAASGQSFAGSGCRVSVQFPRRVELVARFVFGQIRISDNRGQNDVLESGEVYCRRAAIGGAMPHPPEYIGRTAGRT